MQMMGESYPIERVCRGWQTRGRQLTLEQEVKAANTRY